MGLIKRAKKKIKELEEKRQPKIQEEVKTIETDKTEEPGEQKEEPKEQQVTFGGEAAQSYNLQVQILATLQQILEEIKKE